MIEQSEWNMAKVLGKSARCFWILLIFSLFQTLGPPSLHAQGKIFKNSLGMEFTLIPPGEFFMGSPMEETFRDAGETLHKVTITKPFYMQSTEVTVAQWRSLMGKRLLGSRSPSSLPMTRVSWFDCSEFIRKLNERGEGAYRLPSEAEWEYACRAGSKGAFHWGAEIDCTRAMFGNSSRKGGECAESFKSMGFQVDGPAPVKSYGQNPWGLFDMHGNVWEWSRDWYGDYPQMQVVDPTGPDSGKLKVRRGGSWLSEGHRLRCANRAYAHPASRLGNTGLRLVMEVQ